jgi:ATPase subunit of ABC transporter with duplicated ATPase domains
LDNVAGWILELDRGEGIPWKETILRLDKNQSRMALEEKWLKTRKNLERELDWVRQGAKGVKRNRKHVYKNYDKMLNEDQKH